MENRGRGRGFSVAWSRRVERLADLRTLHVCLPGRHEVRLVASFPLDEEHELAAAVCRPDDPLRLESAVKAARSKVLARVKLLTPWLRSVLSTDRASFPFSLLLLQFKCILKRLNQLWAVETLFRLPSILFRSETLLLGYTLWGTSSFIF